VYSRFTGTVYYDNLTVEKLDVPGIAGVGSFEGNLPSYWMKGSESGATLTWATDEFRSMGRSLKIEKAGVTADSVSWISENATDVWSPQHLKDVDIFLGAYVKTMNVNTNPTTDD